jgi:hypothetical protein
LPPPPEEPSSETEDEKEPKVEDMEEVYNVILNSCQFYSNNI